MGWQRSAPVSTAVVVNPVPILCVDPHGISGVAGDGGRRTVIPWHPVLGVDATGRVPPALGQPLAGHPERSEGSPQVEVDLTTT